MTESGTDFNVEEIAERLESDLLEFLRSRSIAVESIELVGLKGAGDSSTVYAILIDGVYHTLKVYREEAAFQREIRHLRRQIPKDRSVLVWPASSNRFHYFIVIIEVPDGSQLHERMLSPIVSEQLSHCLIQFHSLRYRKSTVQPQQVIEVFDEASTDALAHAGLFGKDLDTKKLANLIGKAKVYVGANRSMFAVKRSRAHNDLWWANVIVAEEDVYMIDWENLGRDDYCRDLSFFRIMINYERTTAPVSMWDDEVDNIAFDTFYQPILERYVEVFDDHTFWQRYGLYAFQQACLNFSRAYYGDRRGVPASLAIIKTGMRFFEEYCLQAE